MNDFVSLLKARKAELGADFRVWHITEITKSMKAEDVVSLRLSVKEYDRLYRAALYFTNNDMPEFIRRSFRNFRKQYKSGRFTKLPPKPKQPKAEKVSVKIKKTVTHDLKEIANELDIKYNTMLQRVLDWQIDQLDIDNVPAPKIFPTIMPASPIAKILTIKAQETLRKYTTFKGTHNPLSQK